MISGWYNEAVPASLSVSPSSALRWCGCGFCKEVAASDISSELIVRHSAWADAASSFSPLSLYFSPGKFTQDKLFPFFALNVTVYLLLHFSTLKTDDLHPKMLKIWPMCWWSAVLLYLRSPLLPAAWVEEIRPPLWSGKSLALVWAALRWIRSNSDTLSYFWASGAVFVWRGVCVSFVLLLDLQWVNHCSRFKLWRQRFLPMRHHSSRACVVWADQAIYVLPQQKTVPFASYSFHIVPSLSSANADHILLCLQVLLSFENIAF